MRHFSIRYFSVAIVTILTVSSCTREDIGSGNNDGRMFLFHAIVDDAGSTAATRAGNIKSTDGEFYLSVSAEPTNSYCTDCATKGTPIEGKEDFSDKIESFRVFGWVKSESKQTNLNNVEVFRYTDYAYSPKNGDEFVNRPVTTGTNTRFYAIAPSTPTGITVNPSTNNQSTLAFSYQTPLPNTTDNRDAENQEDFFLGYMYGTLSDVSAPIKFKHPLCAVRFVTGNIAKSFTIQNVKIENINSKGTCKIDASGNITWSSLGTLKTYVQTFDKEVTVGMGKGVSLNKTDRSDYFLLIPQSFQKTSMITVTYTDDGGTTSKEVSFQLYGNKWEAGKTYTYGINSFTDDEVYVNFGEYVKVGGEAPLYEFVDDNKAVFEYKQAGSQYEKMNFPIKNLKVGERYELSFTEKLTKTGDKLFNGAGGPGTYGCGIRKNAITDTGRSYMVSYFCNYDLADVWSHVAWIPTEGTTDYTSTYDSENVQKLVFEATAETMYWVWDYSKLSDDSKIACEVYTNGIRKLEKATGPAVDFLAAYYYGFFLGNSSNSDGYATFKTLADYTGMEFHAKRSADYPKINIPLINLTEGHDYRIDYTVERTYGSVRSGTYYFGFNLQTDPVTSSTSSYNKHYAEGFVDKTEDAKNQTFSITDSYTFTANASTMYWIWELSKFKDDRNTLFFKNVSITDVTSE